MIVATASFVAAGRPAAAATPLLEGSLRNGDLGGGSVINTFPPNHGGSPGVPGVVHTPDGVHYVSTESDGKSNALVNWTIPSAQQAPFRTQGTASFCIKADRATHVSGEVLGDNYGFGSFRNGQSTYATFVSRIANGAGPEDDQVSIGWNTWHSNLWLAHQRVTIEYDRWYDLGFAWNGGSDHFEIWVDGVLAGHNSLSSGRTFPWGFGGSATNYGLGDNHERGFSAYGTAAGVTLSEFEAWIGYEPSGGTGTPGVCDPSGGYPPVGGGFALDRTLLEPGALLVGVADLVGPGSTLKVELVGTTFAAEVPVGGGGRFEVRLPDGLEPATYTLRASAPKVTGDVLAVDVPITLAGGVQPLGRTADTRDARVPVGAGLIALAVVVGSVQLRRGRSS